MSEAARNTVEFERLSYPADAEHAATIRENLRGWLQTAAVATDVAHGLLLAVSEAVENVIAHAYPPGQDPATGATIELTMCLEPTEVVITVADHGLWRPPETTALEHDTADAPARHGRGIILMNNHVDDVAIHHSPAGTTVMLRAVLSPADPAG